MFVLVDIDGTLALRSGREPFDWSAVLSDQPNPAVVTCVRSLWREGLEIVFITGREEFLRDATNQWLETHVGISGQLLMRQTGDFRPDEVVKAEFLELGTIDRSQILLVLDDRDRVVEMWRDKYNLPCFQVAKGDF